jgi:pyroglutamyl-peptidase
MTAPILITTFDTWLPHQKSNASDDLILALEAQGALPEHCRVLHRLPVDVGAAFEQIQAVVAEQLPAYILCCGMAESRSRLSIELQAVGEDQVRCCAIPEEDWNSLRTQWRCAEVSKDAGQFVCNGLYFRLLDEGAHGGNSHSPPLALFVHVPLVTALNRTDLMADFQTLLRQILAWQGDTQRPRAGLDDWL